LDQKIEFLPSLSGNLVPQFLNPVKAGLVYYFLNLADCFFNFEQFFKLFLLLFILIYWYLIFLNLLKTVEAAV